MNKTRYYLSSVVLYLFDFMMVGCSLLLAYLIEFGLLEIESRGVSLVLMDYILFYPLYFIMSVLFIFEKLYTHRYDFWNETQIILRALFLGYIIILGYVLASQRPEVVSSTVVTLSFVIMAFLIPFSKRQFKLFLFKQGLWKRKAKVYADDKLLREEIFTNHYLGYIKVKPKEAPETVFINPENHELSHLKKIIQQELMLGRKVLFIPMIDDYDFTQAHIYQLSNTRTNLVVCTNGLNSKSILFIKRLSDVLMFLIAFPLLLPVMAVIAYKIKKQEPQGSIFFNQPRLGKNGRVFVCRKFRTMYEDGDSILEAYLKENPQEIEHYTIYHKYQNDPRITPIGDFLRRTSLDELPQIFNVLKLEMSFVGPRPYMVDEKEKIAHEIDSVLVVKPGITGLWQASGRSDIDFESRVKLEAWYVRNWNLWMDIVILFKTIKAVFAKKGAS